MLPAMVLLALALPGATVEILVQRNGREVVGATVEVTRVSNDFAAEHQIALDDNITDDAGKIQTDKLPSGSEVWVRAYKAFGDGQRDYSDTTYVPLNPAPKVIVVIFPPLRARRPVSAAPPGQRWIEEAVEYQVEVGTEPDCPEEVMRPDGTTGFVYRCNKPVYQTRIRYRWKLVPTTRGRLTQWFYYPHTGEWKLHQVQRYHRQQIEFGQQPSGYGCGH